VAVSRRFSGEMILVDADFQNPRLGHVFGWSRIAPCGTFARCRGLARSGPADQNGPDEPAAGGPSPAVPRPPRKTFKLPQLLDELRSHYDLVLLQAAQVGCRKSASWRVIATARILPSNWARLAPTSTPGSLDAPAVRRGPAGGVVIGG